MRFIGLSDIKPGMVVATALKDNFGRVLVAPRASVTPQLIPRLKKLNISGLFIEDEWSADIFIDQVVDDKTVNRTIKALSSLNIDKINECASTIVNKLLGAENYSHDMENIREYDDTTYLHCVNVSIHAVTFGIGLGYSFTRLKNLAVGSMLHDVGKQQIPIDIINKKGKLTDLEMSIVRQHPQFGYEILKNNFEMTSSSREIVHQHHENWDGSGYPRGLKGKEIYELASVVHICDVYDALISKRSYKDSFPIQKVITILKDGNNKMFNNELFLKFFKYVPLYHKGTTIKLSNNEEALVIENNRGNMLRPKVMLKDNTVIDLRDSDLIILS